MDSGFRTDVNGIAAHGECAGWIEVSGPDLMAVQHRTAGARRRETNTCPEELAPMHLRENVWIGICTLGRYRIITHKPAISPFSI